MALSPVLPGAESFDRSYIFPVGISPTCPCPSDDFLLGLVQCLGSAAGACRKLRCRFPALTYTTSTSFGRHPSTVRSSCGFHAMAAPSFRLFSSDHRRWFPAAHVSLSHQPRTRTPSYLCGVAILLGTYFLWVLGPKSLASEGPRSGLPRPDRPGSKACSKPGPGSGR